MDKHARSVFRTPEHVHMNTIFLFLLYIIFIFIYTPFLFQKNHITIEILLFYVFQMAELGRLLEHVRESDIVKAIMKYLKTVPSDSLTAGAHST